MIILKQNWILFINQTFFGCHISNDRFIFKTICLFVGNEFRGPTIGFARLPILSSAFTIGDHV